MVWHSKSRRMATAVALLGMGLAVPARADTIVVRASGPSAKIYPPGKTLAATGSLMLKAGDIVTLLDPRGTRTLRGPGNFGVTANANAAMPNGTTLAALLDTKRVRRARTGAVRGAMGDAPAIARRPNLWLVDVAQPGNVCIADSANVRLWRADSAKAATVTLAGGGGNGTVRFDAGESMAAWPAALPVKEGATYRVSGGRGPAEIKLALLSAESGTTNSGGAGGVASALIAHQCKAQLDLLVDSLAAPDSAPAG